jgi:hypothetical protein
VRWWSLTGILVAAGFAPGCSAVGRPVQPVVRAAQPLQPVQGVVFVADGSGDLRQVADALTNVVLEDHIPLCVQRVQWTHGKGAVFLDLYDQAHQKAQGLIVAQQVLAYRTAHPDQRICLVGYSSGAGVVLAAAEQLPAASVDRIVLLSPSVAARHDLRPSLRCSREGIDAFRSEWDIISLALTAMGTADGVGLPVAGRTGFSPVVECPGDELLYQGLRQHLWDSSSRWAGHDGGHFGCFNSNFLRTCVLPPLLGR